MGSDHTGPEMRVNVHLPRCPRLHEAVAVIEDQSGLILIGYTCATATIDTVAQRCAKALEDTRLDDVVNPHVAFPFRLIGVAGHALDVLTVKIGNGCLQARQTQPGKVIGVLAKRSVFACPGELIDHTVGKEVESCTRGALVGQTALIGPDEATFITDTLVGLKGWQWMFLLEGLPAMILGVVAFVWLDDRPANAKWLSDKEKQQVEQDLQLEQQAHAPSGHQSSLSLALKEPKLLVLGLISLCSYVLANTIAFFSPTIIHNSGITDVMHVGFLAAIPALVGIAAMLWVGRHSDRSGERRWHYALPLFAAALSLALLRNAEGSPVMSILLLSIASAGHFASLSVFWSIPPEVLSRRAAAAGIAIVSSIGALGGAIGPSLLGYITTTTGDLGMALRVAAAIVAMGGVIMLLLFRRSQRAQLLPASQEN